MKLRVFKWQMFKALNWYSEQLAGMYLNRMLTESTLYEMKNVLKSIQGRQIQLEPYNQIWQVPVEVRQHSTNISSVEVYISDDTNVLLIE